MKHVFQGNLSLYIVTIIFLVVYPFYLKLLFVREPNEFRSINDLISSIFSGLALIVAFITIMEQRKSFIKQNERLNFTVKVEALSRAIHIRELLLTHVPSMKSDENELAFLSSLYKKLDKESLIMIEKIEKESLNE